MNAALAFLAMALACGVTPVSADHSARPPSRATGSEHVFVSDDQVDPPTRLTLDTEELPAAVATSEVCESCGRHGHGVCEPFDQVWLWDPWLNLDYQFAWSKSRFLPALVTQGTADNLGRLPNADILFGDESVGGRVTPSLRVSLGTWFDHEHTLGVGVRVFSFLTENGTDFFQASDANGNPLLARPFYDTRTGYDQQSSLRVSLPDFRSGEIQVRAANDVVAAETYGRYLLGRSGRNRLDLIIGSQYARINDCLTIQNQSYQFSQTGANFPLAGTTLTFSDQFQVRNEYFGGELGLRGEWERGPWTLSMLGKLGLGNMHQTVTISGETTQTTADNVTTRYNGGVLALGQNLGSVSKDQFTLVPEAEFKVIWRVAKNVDLNVGYSFIYWSQAAMAGEQIEATVRDGFLTPTVNSAQTFGGLLSSPLNGADHPLLNGIQSHGFWVQGLTLGMTIRL